jgi:uncharacterized protein (DUF2147 family)
MSRILSAVALASVLALPSMPLAAEPEAAYGLWKSVPDASGLVVYVRTRACGPMLCAKVERAKDRRGYDTPSSAVGRKLLWDAVPQPDGSWRGRYQDMGGSRVSPVRLEVSGDKLRLRNCEGQECEDIVWTRLR